MDTEFSRHDVVRKRSGYTKRAPASIIYKPGFDLDFTERLLGRRRRKVLPGITGKRLLIQQKRLRELIKPRVTWKELDIEHIDKTGLVLANGMILKSRKLARALEGAVKVVAFIATVGGKIDKEIDSLINGGSLAHGYVADALGSGAVENLADRFHTDVARVQAFNNRTVGLRFSPGYCDWPLTDQQKLFALLDNDSIGVELGDTSLMAPRKSISGVFGIFDNKNGQPANVTYNPCRQCGKKDCIARRVDAMPPSPGR